jgi:hypothetical protein
MAGDPVPNNKPGVILMDLDGNAVELASASSIGDPSDTPWSGTGDGTVIAILKKIALNTTP